MGNIYCKIKVELTGERFKFLHKTNNQMYKCENVYSLSDIKHARDEDLNKAKLLFYDIYYNLIGSSKIKEFIINKLLKLKILYTNITIIYIDIEKVTKISDKKASYEFYNFTGDRYLFFCEYCSAILFYIDKYALKRRYELYGDVLSDYCHTCERFELSDYTSNKAHYKIGDIVQFKYPICNANIGIIMLATTNNRNFKENTIDCYDYSVAINFNDNKKIYMIENDGIHTDDIQYVIDNDIDLAYRLMAKYFINRYDKEYIINNWYPNLNNYMEE